MPSSIVVRERGPGSDRQRYHVARDTGEMMHSTDVNGQHLVRLGRRLMEIGEEALLAGDLEDAVAVASDDPRVITEVLAVLDVLAHWLLQPPRCA